MKRQILMVLAVLVLAMGTVLMAQSNTTGSTAGSQAVDQSGEPETGPGPDVDVDTGASAEGAVDVDVNRETDADTAASGVDETDARTYTGDNANLGDDDDLPETASSMPLVALLGLLAMAGAVALRVSR